MSAYTIPRPDGKVYRRRKPPMALALGWNDDGTAVIVLRTHDIDEALPLARKAWDREGLGEPFPGEFPVLEWIRCVPWDALGLGYDSTWMVTDPGARGSTPCVRFGGDS